MKLRMTRKFATAALLSLLAGSACGMTINPNGTGQVLIFPYYSVNNSQQTLVTVSNPTVSAKSIEVVFHEAYNGKVVYAIDVFLAPHQTWAVVVVAESNIDQAGNAAGISKNIDVCNTPTVFISPVPMGPGPTYDLFSNQSFIGANVDGGPTDDSREHEGFIEVFELSEIHGATAASVWPSGSSENCTPFGQMLIAADYTAPTGGLVGSAAVINVPQGTFFAFEPKAIDGFRAQPIGPLHDETLAMGGDDTSDTVSASIVHHGAVVTTTFPKEQAIDAASALFMADTVFGELDGTQAIGANTDWVLTFPTKQFYVNLPQSAGFGPFKFLFGDAQSPGGGSYVLSTLEVYAHNGDYLNECGFSSCPTSPPFVSYQTQVISFTPPYAGAAPSAVLGSSVVTPAPSFYTAETGLMRFSGLLDTSNEGVDLRGVPVFGVQAINYVNSNVTAGVLSNYSGTARLRTTVSCTVNGAACP